MVVITTMHAAPIVANGADSRNCFQTMAADGLRRGGASQVGPSRTVGAHSLPLASGDATEAAYISRRLAQCAIRSSRRHEKPVLGWGLLSTPPI